MKKGYGTLLLSEDTQKLIQEKIDIGVNANLHTTVVIWKEPIGQSLAIRCGYFSEMGEADFYARFLNETYRKMKFPHLVFIDGALHSGGWADKCKEKQVIEKENDSETEFECCISEEYKNHTNCDEWGVATLWLNNKQGVEYNFCIDNGHNSCAIYKMDFNEETQLWETDTSVFEHYEIDFCNANWKTELEKAMYEVAKKFFE